MIRNTYRTLKGGHFLLGLMMVSTFSCFLSCKKDPTDLGIQLLDPNLLLDLTVEDTFHIQTYSQINDTARGDRGLQLHLGSYVDPEMGKADYGSFFQVDLGGTPSFGLAGVIDSVVLVLDYAGIYGVEDIQSFSVHEVTEDLSADAEYLVSHPLLFDPTELIDPAGATQMVNPSDDLILSSGDTVPAQLRLPLDTALGRRIIDADAMGELVDNATWHDYFKGIYIQSANPTQTDNEGAIIIINAGDVQSGLWIYFKDSVGGEQKQYQFDIGSVRSTKADFYRAGYPVEQVLNDSTQGQNAFYMQVASVIGRMRFPTLENLLDSNDIIINKAELVIPIQYFSGSPYRVPPILFMDYLKSDGTREPVRDFQFANQPNSLIEYDGILKTDDGNYFRVLLNVQIQEELSGEIESEGFVLIPDGFDQEYGFNSGVARIVANGQDGGFKEKPYLRLKYTKY